MKRKTRELEGAALDWVVALCEGHTPPLLRVLRGSVALPQENDPMWCDYLEYSTDWAQGGPIIEREWMDLTPWPNESDENLRWQCTQYDASNNTVMTFGRTLLVAAMRCYVVHRLGEEVDVPEALP